MSLKATRSNGGAKRNEISMKAIVQVIPKCPQAKDTRMQRQLAEMETTTSTESAFCWHQRNGLKGVVAAGWCPCRHRKEVPVMLFM